MKSSGSSRSLLPASARHSPSPLATPSSTVKKHHRAGEDRGGGSHGAHSSRVKLLGAALDPSAYAGDTSASSSNTMGAVMSGSHEMFYPYPQQQHAIQAHHTAAAMAAAAAYGYPGGPVPFLAPAQAMPGMNYPPPQYMQVPTAATVAATAMSVPLPHSIYASSIQLTGGHESIPTSAGSEPSDDLVQHVEKKEHMVAQLGSFLAQMKQESEGSAVAWKEKLAEIAELKRQLAHASEQLAESQAKEQETAAQMAQTLQDLQVAMQEVEVREKRHVEELKIMHSEVEQRQSDADHTKIGYEETVRRLSQELLDIKQSHQQEVAELNDALGKLQDGHAMAIKHLDEERGVLQQTLQALNERLAQMDAAKQELGQHLWRMSKELEQSQQREQDLTTKLLEQARSVDEAKVAWTERFQQTQNDKAEQLKVQAMLQSQLAEMDAKWQEERSQKEELNSVVMRELQRFQLEMAQLQEARNADAIRLESEKDNLAHALTDREQQLEAARQQIAEAMKVQEQMSAQLAQAQADNGFLQQTESEKSSTLQELNSELHSLMQQLGDARAELGRFHGEWEGVERHIARAVQLRDADLRKRTADASVVGAANIEGGLLSPIARLPDVIVWIEDLVSSASTLEQLKLSLLRAQQDRDSVHESLRMREQELIAEAADLRSELETTREDAKLLAQEIQQLSLASGGTEAKLSSQASQLAKELEDVRAASGLQVLQLQRLLDAQRQRSQQLENEKKELLHEAEQLNSSMESLFQTKNGMQAELDQLRTTWRELQLEHSDLKETHEDLAESSQRAIGDLNAALQALRSQLSDLRASDDAQKKALEQLTTVHAALATDYEALQTRSNTERAQWGEKERETARVLEDKHRRLTDMMELLTQLQSQKEFLEQTRVSEAKDTRSEVERLQQQLQALVSDKKRLELALAAARSQLEQQQGSLIKLQDEKRHGADLCSEQDEQLATLNTELQRVQGELERVSRAKSSLQLEVRRLADDSQDASRQLEVVRRDMRAAEKSAEAERDRLHKELEQSRVEANDGAVQIEELQAKLASIQKAANATINELMAELQNAQDSISLDKARLSKDTDAAKAQLRSAQDELRRKDAELHDVATALELERGRNQEKETELSLKLSRLSSVLESKKQESESLSHEVEVKAARIAECERKLAPLATAKDNLQSKVSELKQALEQKSRETHELEERHRDELTRAVRDKRELESAYLTLKEDMEAARAQTSGHQHQWQSENKALKSALERSKSDLGKATADLVALAQRLETCQQAANETIADLTARVHAAQQETEKANASLGMERDHRREAEVQRMELQRALRQRAASSSDIGAGLADAKSLGLSAAMNNSSEDTSGPGQLTGWTVGSSSRSVPAIRGPESPASSSSSSTGESFCKFYANEPLTSAELSSLSVAAIKAQIGLDLSSGPSSASFAVPGGQRSVKKGNQVHAHRATPTRNRNNDEIPPLPLESLALDGNNNPPTSKSPSLLEPEADASERRHGSSSTRAGDFLAALSSRSVSDRYAGPDTKSRSHNNTAATKKPPQGKKAKKGTASASTAAVYGAYSSLPVAASATSSAALSGSPVARARANSSASSSKVLPRIAP